MTLAVRRLGEGDLTGFRAMNAVFASGFGEDGAAHYGGNPPEEGAALGWLAKDDHVGLLAEMDGAPVGALAGYVLDKFEQVRRELFIYDLAVLEDHRRQGVASALIEEARRVAKATECHAVFVVAEADDESKPARALYRTFAETELRTHSFDIVP